jgi:hypothetical protein
MTRSPNAGTRGELWARAGLLATALAAVGAVGLLASACSGSSGEGVAQVGSATTTTSSSSSSNNPQLAFARCMRRNGAPDFPDADNQGHFNLTPQIPRHTPQLDEAYEACDHLKAAAYALDPQLAEGRQAKLQLLLDYAACMRSHGVPNFPDPTVDDHGMGFGDLSESNINQSAPVFKAAERACARPGSPPPKPRRSTLSSTRAPSPHFPDPDAAPSGRRGADKGA